MKPRPSSPSVRFAVAQIFSAVALVLAAIFWSSCATMPSGAASNNPPSSGGGFAALAAMQAEPAPRQRINFDDGWRFIKGDPAEVGTSLNYGNLREALLADIAPASLTVRPTAGTEPGADVSYVKPDFNDSSWRALNLPHDWGIEGPFDQALNGSTGKLPYFGVAWYRKTFDVPADYAGKRVFLNVDGAMSYASVWLNGHYLGGWPYGYNSWQADLSYFLKPGQKNVLAIRLDNPNNSSRWYPGGGIYRNVWLEVMNPVHVEHSGVFVTTPEISKESATVNAQVTVENQSTAPANVTVNTKIYALGADGKLTGAPVATATASGLSLAAGGNSTANLDMKVADPKLWNLQTPNLYAVVTTVQQDGHEVDAKRTNFGIRTLKFDPNTGFYLNGERVKFNGVCDHSDLGALGSVVNTRGLERQIEILQGMGCNAIRTSHNMPSPELLDLCDRMGMLVMDESFDCWAATKQRASGNDYARLWPDWHENDIRAEVRRDRNHPSVIMYSAGNEISEQGTARGNQILAELITAIRSEDTTRPVTTANNNSGFSGFDPAQYIYGFNYEPQRRITYPGYHADNPGVFIYSSESASCISSRGVYVFPVVAAKNGGGASDHQMSSYDLYAPPWADAPDAEFAHQDMYPYVAGEFVWTGFDYLGEPTNNARGTPDASRSSYFGIIDLAGFPKDRYYIYQARWRPDYPMAHILPHWNWAGREGEVTPVHVYTSGDEAELFLNGVSLGRKKKGEYEYRIRWDDVKYQPGELKVIAYKNGQKWAEDTVKTTGPAAQLTVTPDRTTIADDGHDLSYITVAVRDKDGLMVPTAMNKLHYEISGPGEIVAVDNGDATSHDPMQGTHDSKAFNGLALVIVRSKPGQAGNVTLTATSDGLATGTAGLASVAPKG